MRRIGLIFGAIMVGTAACSGASSPAPESAVDGPLSGEEVVVGGTTSATDQIMSAMIVVAFSERGATVIDRSNKGDDALNRDDLVAGRLDVVPEDLSTGWFIHLGETTEFKRTAEQAEALRTADRANGVEWSDHSAFDDAIAPIATEAFGTDSNGETLTMDRLALRLEGDFDARVCVDTATLQSPDGLVRFEQATGFTVPAEQLDVVAEGEPLRLVVGGQCSVAFASAVQPELLGAKVAIVDRLDSSAAPALVFAPRNAAYMFTAELYDEQIEWLQPFLEALMVTLDRKAMTALKFQLAEGAVAVDVARSHLQASGLAAQ